MTALANTTWPESVFLSVVVVCITAGLTLSYIFGGRR